ncbi:MAG: SPASM domain-containing protein, partial [Myxococcota bacterium]
DGVAQRLAGVMGQVNLSIDGLGDVYRAVRGWQGDEMGLRALRRLARAGARAGVNTVVSRPLLEEPDALDMLADAIVAAGAVEWQLLRFKPVGRGTETWETLAPSAKQLQALWERVLAIEARTGLIVRYDCAMAPFLAAAGVPVARMEALGVVGCTGSETLWARDDRGGWAPCSFVAATQDDTPLAERWRTDPTLQSWRDRALNAPEPCASCSHRTICRGGCRAIAGAIAGDPMAPDPQCPRVMAWSARR